MSKCYRCFRPEKSCYCKYIKSFDCGVKFVLLMHPKEAFKQKTGTGRLTNIALIDSEIIGSIVIAIILLIIPAEIGTLIIRLLGIAIMLVGIGLLFFEIKSKPLVIYAEEVPENSNKDKD